MRFRFTFKQTILLMATFALTAFYRLCVWLLPPKALYVFMGKQGHKSPDSVDDGTKHLAAKIAWAVGNISEVTPWESKCLVQALTAQTVLNLLRVPSTLYLGMSMDSATNKLLAHAWLRCGEKYITGDDERQKFKAVVYFASCGKKVKLK